MTIGSAGWGGDPRARNITADCSNMSPYHSPLPTLTKSQSETSNHTHLVQVPFSAGTMETDNRNFAQHAQTTSKNSYTKNLFSAHKRGTYLLICANNIE